MNLSGEAVREAAQFYKIAPENIIVIFDDISLEPGTAKKVTISMLDFSVLSKILVPSIQLYLSTLL